MTEKNKGGTEGESSKNSRPTLFNLLEVLANYSMTTPSQRQCIRDIVTEFLANKFEHSKVYSYIGAVVGHDRLHAVIKQLEADPDRSPLPDQDGLMKIESAFNLTRNYKNPNNTNGDNNANKDEILRSIRRNLSKKCDLTKSSSFRTASAGVLLQKACWLPIRRSLTAGPLYGHSIICIGNRAYILGGSNGRTQGFNLSKAHVVNLLDFSSKQIMLSGEVPSHREGNSCNVAVLNQSHSVVLFGGFNGEEFFNDVYVLDLEKRRWTKRNPTGPTPTERDEHTALVYPPRCDLKNSTNNAQTTATTTTNTNNAENGATNEGSTETVKENNVTVYLFVFGGKTGSRNQFQCLNDMWAYNVTANYWVQVETGESRPTPRFGLCALWADDETVCVFGGETSSTSGYVDRTERVLLDDLWMFHLTTPMNKEKEKVENKESNTREKLTGVWMQDYYEGNIGPRSHYSSIFIAQRSKELNTGAPRTIERLMFLTGGLTYAPGNKKVVVASDKLYFYFFSQKRWYSLKPNYPRNYVGEPFEPRQLHVACFFEKKNILFPGTKPSVPCIFFHGGFHKKQILSDSWVLSLTGEDLFFKNSLLSPETSNGANKVEMRMYPPWYYRESHSPSLLWGMCSVQKWVFGALAHLVDNALKETVATTNLRIKFEPTPKGEELMLSVQDDGNGLDYNSMNRLLKLFGRSYTTYNASEEQETANMKEEYGLGFKLAYGRLGNSVAVMSRTHDSIGIGMLSLELMCQCESREMAAPMCMWKLPSKELINRDGPGLIDQRHHQRLLMSYSPFNSAALLAEQINVLGVNPGTRMLFWQLRDDLDNLVMEQGTLVNSMTRKQKAAKQAEEMEEGTQKTDHAEVGSVVYFKEQMMEGGIVMDSSEHSNEHGQTGEAGEEEKKKDEKEGTEVVEGESGEASKKDKQENEKMEVDQEVKKEKEKSKEESELSKKEKERLKTVLGYQGEWYESFPLWKNSKYSMDYCLPVYLYWLHLHSSCTLSVQDVQLKPNPVHNYPFQKKTSQLEESDQNLLTGTSVFENESSQGKRSRSQLPSDDEDVSTKKPNKEGSPTKEVKLEEKEKEKEKEGTERKGLKLLGTTVGGTTTNTVSTGSTVAATEDCFLDLHSHVMTPQQMSTGMGHDYSCGKNNCNYCGVSPIGRSLVGEDTLFSFLRSKLHKAVQLPYLFHPEDHAQGAFALIGFLNDPTTTLYLSGSGMSMDMTSNSSMKSGSSNLGGLPSPTNRPLAPTSFVVTETLQPMPAPATTTTTTTTTTATETKTTASSPTKSRKGKGQRGRGAAAAAAASASESKAAAPAEGAAPEQEKPTKALTQVIFSGSMSAENLEAESKPDESASKDPERESRLKMFAGFAGVGAGAQIYTPTSLGSSSMEKLGQSGTGFFAKQYQSAKVVLEDRVCEAGVLLYYKGRLIRRLEGPFPAPLDDLESARLPAKPSLFKGNLYRFALTAVVNVPSWLVPSITKQEFVHENNLVFQQFSTKLIKLLTEYCKVCLDEHTRHQWYLERMRNLIDYDMANQTFSVVAKEKKEEVEGLEDEVVPSWKVQDSQETTVVRVDVTSGQQNMVKTAAEEAGAVAGEGGEVPSVKEVKLVENQELQPQVATT